MKKINGRSSVRTRLYPPLTDSMHIGDVRLAIYNHLYARSNRGSFVLCVSDLDNKYISYGTITDVLNWLGIEWDEGPYNRSGRMSRYRDVVESLIKKGLAYPDNAIDEMTTSVYRGGHRKSSAMGNFHLWDDVGWPIRLKIPEREIIYIEDMIRGAISWNTSDLGDPLLMTSDGNPTPLFASVVDDIDMKISHVIRSSEDMSMTPSQLVLYRCLDEVPPFFAHVPVLCCKDESKKKLSKRDTNRFFIIEHMNILKQMGYSSSEIFSRLELNPTSASYYQCLGFHPQAVKNYLSSLGWIKNSRFYLDDISRRPAEFSPKDMVELSAEFVGKEDRDNIALRCLPFLIKAKLISDPPTNNELKKVKEVVSLCFETFKIYSGILKHSYFFKEYSGEYTILDKDEKFFLDIFCTYLSKMKWDVEGLSCGIKEFADIRYMNVDKITSPLRIAICGCKNSPGIAYVMNIIGKEETLKRIKNAIKKPFYTEMGEG